VKVCKTFMRRFDSDPRLQRFKITYRHARIAAGIAIYHDGSDPIQSTFESSHRDVDGKTLWSLWSARTKAGCCFIERPARTSPKHEDGTPPGAYPQIQQESPQVIMSPKQLTLFECDFPTKLTVSSFCHSGSLLVVIRSIGIDRTIYHRNHVAHLALR
jgi:hypothetical protein